MFVNKEMKECHANLTPVTEERRKSARGILGFVQNIYCKLINLFADGKKGPYAAAHQAEDSGNVKKGGEEKSNEKSNERTR